MLVSACAGLTSCDDEDDDPKTENNGNGGSHSGDNGSSQSNFQYTKLSLDAMFSKCESGSIVRDGDRYLLAYFNSALNVYEFKGGKLVSITSCDRLKDKSKAQSVYNSLRAQPRENETYKLIDNYVACTSTDPDSLDSFSSLSIAQLQAYLPIYISSLHNDDEQDTGDIINPVLSPADAYLLCRSQGSSVMSGYSKLYDYKNNVLKSYQFYKDKIVSVSTYKDYETEERVLGALEDALLTSKDMGEWTIEGTYLVVTSDNADVLKPYLGMTREELANFLDSSK